MPDIVEAWMWQDPGKIIERLLERSARDAAKARGVAMGHAEPAHPAHDRYYTMARRASVKRAKREGQ